MSGRYDHVLTATGVRRKKYKRKGDLTKMENLATDQLALSLTDRDLDDISHAKAQCTSQRDELEDLHDRVLVLMDKEKASAADFTKEESEYTEQMDKYNTTYKMLSTLEKISTYFGEFSEKAAECEQALDDALGADPTARGVELELVKVQDYISRMSLIYSKIPTGLHAGLTTTLSDLKKKLRTIKPTSTPATVRTSVTHDPASTTVYQPSRLPPMAFPKFNGDKLKWPLFWEGFTTLLKRDKRINEFDKLSYLRTSILTPEIDRVLKGTSGKDGDFDLVTKRLEALYHDPRHVYKTQVRALVDGKMVDRAGALDYQRHVQTCIEILEASGQADFYHIASILVEMKLSGKLREDWIREAGGRDEVPDLQRIMRFLEKVGEEQQNIDADKPKTTPYVAPTSIKPRKAQVHYTQPAPHPPRTERSLSPPYAERTPRPVCQLCSAGRHPLYFCLQFKAMNLQQKKDTVDRLKMCRNCLGTSHTLEQCTNSKSCKKCHQRHNTCLHDYRSAPVQTTAAPPTQSSPATTPTLSTTTQPSTGSGDTVPACSLPTAVVTVESNGVTLRARALLDVCSTDTFISTRLVQKLSAVTRAHPSSASGVGDITGLQCQRETRIIIHPLDSDVHPPFVLTAHVTPTIAMKLPLVPLQGVEQLPFLHGLELADPAFNTPGRVDLLLGIRGTSHMSVGSYKHSENGRYHANQTIYGWVVTGWDEGEHRQSAVFTSICKPPDDISRFWEVEDCPDHSKALSRDEEMAVSHFESTTTRESDGRYVVSLPRKVPTPELGQSRPQAMKRFLQNRKSLERKGQWQAFGEVIQEYLDLGHAERVPTAELDGPYSQSYYLPMHGVIKESSTTTKLRVVFDASATTTNGLSLNDTLLAGPNQYPLLTNVIINFRKHRIGMTSDISKMFREVGLAEQDRDLHRFLWQTGDGPIQDYRMKRVTFGVTSSPFLATQTLRKLADDYQTTHPAAAETIRTSFYVDDCITGADSEEGSVSLRTELNSLLGNNCMSLRKWRSNSTHLQQTIPSNLCEIERDASTSPELSLKTLGIHWDTTTDTLYISVPIITTGQAPTKRQVSSDLARTYDVLGWFSPSMVLAKLTIQKLWVQGLGWDETVSEEMNHSWTQWTQELPLLGKHPIPRYYYCQDKTRLSIQLHGFADASQSAYGAVVYLRAFYSDTTTSVSLVTSKTKVAPIKPLTIPKLELCGTVLLSQLLNQIQQDLDISIEDIYAWTDSTIVLGWLHQKPGKLKVYVANRVVTITERIPAECWRHVPTDSNPADMASRGMMPRELVACRLWWDGPGWLHSGPDSWPSHPEQRTVLLPEIRTGITMFTTPQLTKWSLMEKYSSLTKLKRVTAWALRFLHNYKMQFSTSYRAGRNKRHQTYLSTHELHLSEQILVKSTQHEYYQEDIKSLCKGEALSHRSKLVHLNPLLDQQGVLRVGGRLDASELDYATRHPAILPRRSRLLWLILKHLHEHNNHVGASTMMGLLAEHYSVIGVRASIRTLTRSCLTCRKVHQRNAHQIMGQLPNYRSISSPVFSQVGVDFAGPFMVKSGPVRKPQKTKAYVSLFVCMATKAVHLELVTDLTTKAFLAALHRFTSRRGLPQTVFSDNGTNFVGADRELAEAHQLLQQKDTIDAIHHDLSMSRVEWKHTPSRTPHFGGLWESNVKSFKTLLRKTIGPTVLTFEELTTVLCQVEATLNSRPLVPLQTIPADGTLALTPGHFLVGHPLRSLPCMESVQPGSLHKRWNLCQDMQRRFWKDWSHGYLLSINRLNKWTRPQRNLKVGDVVLVKDQDLFTHTWPLGLISDVHPGPDDKVRTVTVKTAKGYYRRPVVKLTLLLPEDEQTSFLPPEDGRA